MTRGFISILNFDFKSAFKYNALSIPLFAGIAFYFLFSLTDIIFNKKYVYAIEKQLSKKYMYFIYIILLVISVFLKYKTI